jgi:uncharacterized protein YhfF
MWALTLALFAKRLIDDQCPLVFSEEGDDGWVSEVESVDGVPDGGEIVAFWELARKSVGLGRLLGIVGLSSADDVAPPAWAFGDSPRLADELLALVLAGTKTATSSGAWEYESGDEMVPQEGDLSIILDGRGHPRALVRTTAVQTLPFAEVDAEFARLEGEHDRSLQMWRVGHEANFRRSLAARGAVFDTTVPLVLERFELRYPHPR